jgi:hypothetical protein
LANALRTEPSEWTRALREHGVSDDVERFRLNEKRRMSDERDGGVATGARPRRLLLPDVDALGPRRARGTQEPPDLVE